MSKDGTKLDAGRVSANGISETYAVSPVKPVHSGAVVNSVSNEITTVPNNRVIARYIAEKNNMDVSYEYEKKKNVFGIESDNKSKVKSITITNSSNGRSVTYSADSIRLREGDTIIESHILAQANDICRDFQTELDYTDIVEGNFKHEPEDPFESIDDAALAWSLTYNCEVTGDLEQERFSKLFPQDGKYSFNKPIKSTYKTKDNGDEVLEVDQDTSKLPGGGNDYRGTIHNHPPIGDLAEYYSPGDLHSAQKGQLIGKKKPKTYLLTPNGRLERIQFSYGQGRTYADHYLLTSDLPKIVKSRKAWFSIVDYPDELGPLAEQYQAPKNFYPTSVNENAEKNS